MKQDLGYKTQQGTFVDRLLAEETELNDKKAKLQTFIDADAFKDVDKEQQALLKIQLNAMATYSECLNQRLIQINNSGKAIAETLSEELLKL